MLNNVHNQLRLRANQFSQNQCQEHFLSVLEIREHPKTRLLHWLIRRLPQSSMWLHLMII